MISVEGFRVRRKVQSSRVRVVQRASLLFLLFVPQAFPAPALKDGPVPPPALDPVPVAQGITNQGLLKDAQEKLASEQWAEAVVLLKSYLGNDFDVSVSVLIRDLGPRLDLVRALTELGRREEALAVLDRMHSRLPRGHELRAKLEFRMGSLATLFLTEETFNHYQAALAHLRADQLELAKARLEKAISREPDHLSLWLGLAQVNLLEGQVPSAEEKLKTVLKLNPHSTRGLFWSARLKMLQGDRRAAMKTFENLLKREGWEDREEEAALRVWLSELWIIDRKKVRALDLLSRALKSHPNSLPVALAWLQATGSLNFEEPTRRERAKQILGRAVLHRTGASWSDVKAASEQPVLTRGYVLFPSATLSQELREWVQILDDA